MIGIDIQKIFVVGAGTMGGGIAQVAAASGFDVILNDITEPLVNKGRDRIATSLGKLVKKGKLQQSDMDETLSRITTRLCFSSLLAGMKSSAFKWKLNGFTMSCLLPYSKVILGSITL